MRVLRKATYIFGDAGAQHGTGYGGQLTELVTDSGIVFWTREGWLTVKEGAVSEFFRSANERIGLKEGRARGKTMALHAAPDDAWEAIAEEVARRDTLGRPVIRHARWTVKTAPLELESWLKGERWRS